jgi:Zn-finger nucleic acid-binding protein
MQPRRRKAMECPVCGDRLRPVEKYGVEVEVCPGCKGVWLDRGELETIIETAGGGAGTTSRDSEKTSRDDEYYGDRQGQTKKKKKGGLLGGLMDSIGGGGED